MSFVLHAVMSTVTVVMLCSKDRTDLACRRTVDDLRRWRLLCPLFFIRFFAFSCLAALRTNSLDAVGVGF